MIMTIANDVTVSVIFAESNDLAHFLVGEAEKTCYSPYISTSGRMMGNIICQSHPA
jgi:hypothetical protein